MVSHQRLHDFWTLKAEIEVVLKLFSSFYSEALLKTLPQFEEIYYQNALILAFLCSLSVHFFLSIYQEASTQLFKNKVISQKFFKLSAFLKLLS